MGGCRAIGYKVYLTETCEDDQPYLITHVAISAGPIADGDTTDQIHKSLQNKNLLPGLARPATHIVDTGYLDAKLLLTNRQNYNIDLLGHTRPDYRWQARAKEGFAAADFHVDRQPTLWQKQQDTCPEGKISASCSEVMDTHGQETVKIKFAQKTVSSVLAGLSVPLQGEELLLSESLLSIKHY
ncbi:hypothetical protein PZB74_09050 [Porifericola rhodea]|uniref:hypothetical protein n=1 Tax=Porifericola rhodea TaxID=930972 RepID=UPI0026654508|nr:hypothetical protein [Porifericola rhodea]WKN33478.1 hypothetical protein PZB74_09050 [Porifericola rhodea]